MSPGSFHRDLRAALRERALDVAARVTVGSGWSAVRMTAIADEVGVSRQTLYAEFGSRASLAEALVERELRRVLDAVRVAMRDADTDVAAVEAAVAAALREAGASALVHGALRSVDPSMDLLRLLTIDAGPLVAAATTVVCGELSRADTSTVIEPVVRLTVSHVLAAGADPDEVARRIVDFARPSLMAAGLTGSLPSRHPPR